MGSAVNGVYTIFPAGEVNATKAYCDMTVEPEGWTIFQRRMNGLTDFYRNWEDYKYGFGKPNDEYWLGNSYVHQLTKNRDCQLRIDLVNWDNLARYAEYEQFSIGDENSGYRLSIGTYSGNADVYLRSIVPREFAYRQFPDKLRPYYQIRWIPLAQTKTS
ncbi:hypothetical protein FSP39_008649 [Pinctada imbricata]|uniref:Fibrinogen C-terminal domain-containing protein n=1 Tax=Pinctada imbricata TaxID=66713 RepID=A0AA89C159_PINIB|nr:hypothetical protein FSP39_008649 [Pinctada imbricata]